MKTCPTPAVLVFAALTLPICLSAPDGGSRMPASAEFVDPAAPAAAAISRTGAAAINWLGGRLAHEISAALARNGPEAAAAIAHLKTLGGPDQPLPGMPSIKAVKRTSLRLLDAANAPDAAEQQVLELMDQQLRAGETPSDLLVQRVTASDGSIEWRVYRPLAVLPVCLACHGDPHAQSPALQARLREKAPTNIATGYAAGEWRGIIRVTVAPAR